MLPTDRPVPETLKVAVWLVVGAAVVAPLTLALTGVVAGFYDRGGLFGHGGVPDTGGPPPEPPDHATHWFIAATVTGFAVPVAGILLSILTKQVLPRVLLSVVIAITALVLAIAHIDDATPAPVDNRPHYCQEHSGGDTTCPGG